MKHLFTISVLVFALNFMSAQEAYLNVGRNFTSYDYTNSQGEENPTINSSNGASYSLGYIFKIRKKFGVATGLTLDQYNATGGNYVYNYSWDTNYLGLQGMAKYTLLAAEKETEDAAASSSRKGRFAIHLNAGINLNHIISGEQKINGQTFDLTSEDEFKGLFIKPGVGLDLQYFLLDHIAVGLTYHLSKNFAMSSGEEELNFNNNQLQFGLLMSLN